MKKYVSTLLVFAIMLVFSTSAFAIPGMGDTMEKAIKIEPGIRLNGIIQIPQIMIGLHGEIRQRRIDT